MRFLRFILLLVALLAGVAARGADNIDDAATAVISESTMNFADGVDLDTEYAYDANGNMLIDSNKGNVRAVVHQGSSGATVLDQTTYYYPYGMPMAESTSPDANRYKYTAKELFTDSRLNLADHGARMYDPAICRWISADPLSWLYQNISHYCYALDNPISFIDLDGRKVYISGTETKAAISQLKKAVGKSVKLSVDKSGKLSYKSKSDNLTGNAKRLAEVIDDSSITVNLKTTKKMFTSTGKLFTGGAYMGNDISINEDGSVTSTANQEVNPKVLKKLSDANGKPGADMLHEVTEAYEGAKESMTTGKASPDASQSDTNYKSAHDKATPQSGSVFDDLIYENVNVNEFNFNSEATFKIVGIEWFTIDKKGNKVVLQTLRNNDVNK